MNCELSDNKIVCCSKSVFCYTSKSIDIEQSKLILKKSRSLRYGLLSLGLAALKLTVSEQQAFQVIRHGRTSVFETSEGVRNCNLDLYNSIGCYAISHP
ncbi:MAG: hypothetical protein ACSW8D_03460, partial [Prevotella sp.]